MFDQLNSMPPPPQPTPWPAAPQQPQIPQDPQWQLPSSTAATRRPLRPGRAVLAGSVAALVCGLVWYAIVVATDNQYVYLAIGFGFVVGTATAIGAGRSGLVAGGIALVITAIGILTAYYFINRHVLIEAFAANGVDADVPLIGDVEQIRSIMRAGFETETSELVFSGIAVLAATLVGLRGTRLAEDVIDVV